MPIVTRPPTPEEFEQARQRELARLNLRLSSITGRTFHTSEDSELLEGEDPERRGYDMEIVRRWVARSDGHAARAEATNGSRASSTRTTEEAKEVRQVQ